MALVSPRASARSYRIAPPAFYGDVDAAVESLQGEDLTPLRSLFWQLIEWQRLSAEVINRLMDGKDNATGTLTLTASVASTTLSDRRIGANTQVHVVPTTANAAAELATLYQTLPNVTEGEAVLNHANNAQVDRTFGYVLRG